LLSNTGFDFTVITTACRHSRPAQLGVVRSGACPGNKREQLADQFSVTKKFDSMSFTAGAYTIAQFSRIFRLSRRGVARSRRARGRSSHSPDPAATLQ